MWLEHRQEVNLARNDLRQQIREYYDAAFKAADDEIREQYALIDVDERLAKLDPASDLVHASSRWKQDDLFKPEEVSANDRTEFARHSRSKRC